uniref:HCLS1-associated protein X-1 n=1 Tax=Cacopsylla melanoneura TaxID=428564 RepID=A0A8D9A5X4_9HEMI
MGIFDALKGLFGGGWPRNKQSYNSNDNQKIPPSNSFIKPDWANEDEDSDDDLAMDAPQGPQRHFTFSVFSNPLEIHHYFEHQMNEMARHFQEALGQTDQFFNGSPILDSFFGQNQFPSIDSFFGQNGGQFTTIDSLFGQNQIPAILPPPIEEQNPESLRDRCLKPDARKQLKEHQNHPVADSDLDKEIKNGQIKLFKPNKESSSSSSTQIYTLPPPQNNKPQVFSSQVFTKVVRRADGSTEEIRTKQIGDQKYTKIVRTDPQGQMTIHEDIVNIDEDKLKDFQSVGETPLPRIDFKDWFKFRL